jgi:hypothetical protein
MDQFDISEKLLAKHGCKVFFGDDSDTTSSSLEPCTPKTPSNHVRSDPDGSDDDDGSNEDDDDF